MGRPPRARHTPQDCPKFGTALRSIPRRSCAKIGTVVHRFKDHAFKAAPPTSLIHGIYRKVAISLSCWHAICYTPSHSMCPARWRSRRPEGDFIAAGPRAFEKRRRALC